MMEGWKTISFRTRAEMLAFIERHQGTYLMYELKIESGFAVNYKSLLKR